MLKNNIVLPDDLLILKRCHYVHLTIMEQCCVGGGGVNLFDENYFIALKRDAKVCI